MQSIAPFFPWLALATALCAFLAACLGRENQARWFMAAALPWLGGLVLHVFLLRGYLPMHGAFEGSLNVSLFFSACALCFPVRNGRKGIASSQAFLAAAQFLILLPVAVFGAVPMPAENTASLVWTQLFFLFRHMSMGFLLFSGLSLASSALAATPSGATMARTQGRNVLLLGICAFLASEVAGCYWCLLGWGDTWRWSGNFFRSTLFYLLIMLACHLPSRWFASYKVRSLVMGVPPLTVFCIVYVMNLGY